MSSEDIHIRRLAHREPEEVALYRAIRLESLSGSPEAFGSTFETENAQPLTWFADRLASSTVLGAFQDSGLAGVAAFAVQQGQKRAHKGLLWGMYVRPSARAGGIGRRLIEAIFDIARPHVELIQLTVVRDNVRARRLYASLGFIDYGLETKALKHGGRYFDEYLMMKDLSDTAMKA